MNWRERFIAASSESSPANSILDPLGPNVKRAGVVKSAFRCSSSQP
jgi:hypothetical protein